MTLIRHLDNPEPARLGNDIDECITLLAGPTRIRVSGRDSNRCRVLVTLLHGNEPSGLKAFLHLYREGFVPAVDTYVYLIGIDAALMPPLFSHRFIPGRRDWNRCFNTVADPDHQQQICAALLAELDVLQPEIVIDMHNTSGEGPAFGVARHYNQTIDSVVSLFTDRLMVTDLKLGSIMERSTASLPIITIECGGAYEATSDNIAREGLLRFLGQDDVLSPEQRDWGLEILHNPVRLVLDPDASLDYAEQDNPATTLTLRVDIEHFNFSVTEADTRLGWLRDDDAKLLAARDPDRNNLLADYYYVRDGGLYTSCRQKLFMITSIPEIALSDCLWYAVRL